MIKVGRIIKALAGFYDVALENDIIQCKARGKFRKEDIKPLVGDWVSIEILPQNKGYILDIQPRKNCLIRPLIANIDQAILVFSCKEPDFSSLLLDRFLAVIESQAIQPIICISKMDLVDENDPIFDMIFQYRKAGYAVYPFSSYKEMGTDIFETLFDGKISVVTGQSGVGKSSLFNRLNHELSLETQEISKALGRGKHTTRHVELIPFKHGWVADTPGFSSLEITLTPLELSQSYHDFKDYSALCRFRGCLHDQEPGCMVKKKVEMHQISQDRYQHYLQFLNEARHRKPKY